VSFSSYQFAEMITELIIINSTSYTNLISDAQTPQELHFTFTKLYNKCTRDSRQKGYCVALTTTYKDLYFHRKPPHQITAD